MAHEPGIGPAESAAGMDAEQRRQASRWSERKQNVKRGAVGLAAVDTIAERLHRRRLEQAADRKLNIQRRADPADQPRRQQRMTPKRKEVVVDPHTLQPKHLRKQRAQDLLLRRARYPPHRTHRLLRRRQRTTVKLAVGRQRKPLKHHKRRWHHVLGKALTQMRTQHRCIRNRSTRRNNIANQPLAPRAVLARNHRSLRNIPMPNQRSLDLPRLDPEPAHLHLRIRTPQELQHPVTTPARQVPGAVHPAPRYTKRVRDKPFRRQTRTANIPTRKTRPRNVKLTAHTNWYRLQAAVQNVDLRVPDRTADRHDAVIRITGLKLVGGAATCCLGWAVMNNDLGLWNVPTPGSEVRAGHALTADDDAIGQS